MATITEDYCSYEVAKLLKEKEFDEACRAVYEEKVLRINTLCDYHNSELSSYVCAPTHQMAMKWLREVHNIFIEISVDEMLKDEGYQWALYNNDTKEIKPYSGWGDSYEEACEAALNYCLENLI
jgi:hypothetical protein